MQNKSAGFWRKRLFSVLRGIAVFAFWITVWQIASLIVAREVILPSPLSVAARFTALMQTGGFYSALFGTLLRVSAGYLCGTAAGILLGFLMHFSKTAKALFSPIVTIVRTTPVASFIILALVLIKNSHIPAFITFLMVLPMLSGTVAASLSETDKKLIEAADMYGIRGFSRLKVLYIPSISAQLTSMAISALGFAWKAGIAAEVLCYPKNSIGKHLHDTKSSLETADLFAYTLLVIIVSLVLEKLLRTLLKKKGAKSR